MNSRINDEQPQSRLLRHLNEDLCKWEYRAVRYMVTNSHIGSVNEYEIETGINLKGYFDHKLREDHREHMPDSAIHILMRSIMDRLRARGAVEEDTDRTLHRLPGRGDGGIELRWWRLSELLQDQRNPISEFIGKYEGIGRCDELNNLFPGKRPESWSPQEWPV